MSKKIKYQHKTVMIKQGKNIFYGFVFLQDGDSIHIEVAVGVRLIFNFNLVPFKICLIHSEGIGSFRKISKWRKGVKSETKEHPTPQIEEAKLTKTAQYPNYKQSVKTSLIILFDSQHSGKVILNESETYEQGNKYSFLEPYDDDRYWALIPEVVLAELQLVDKVITIFINGEILNEVKVITKNKNSLIVSVGTHPQQVGLKIGNESFIKLNGDAKWQQLILQ